MDLNLVRTFSRVVEAESFTAAARSLGVRKSSVSRAVSRLEEQLGARLLERTTRQVKLTVTGRVYYDGAVRALAALTDAEQFVAESQGEPRGVVRLSVPLSADRGCLSDIVTRFTERYPAIRVEVSFTDRVVDLVGEGFDLAVRGSRNGRLQGQSLIARKVAQMSLWLLAAPSYLKSRRLPRRPADLRNLDFILYAHGGNTFKTWELMGPRGLEPVDVTGALSSDDALFIRELVLRGAGITLMVPRMEDLRSGALVRVLPDYEVPDLTISLVMPSNRHLPRRVALFRDALIEGFKAIPGALDESMANAPKRIA
jgi:DNA-binding transcriptional LysR family regulator